MFVTYVTYAFVLALLIWGGKFAHGEQKFHENSSSLEVTKCLRGFAALGVLLHHVSQQEAFQGANGGGQPGELAIFVNAGFFFVSIFFFCSGFGLIKSLNTKENYFNGFLKKRVVKTLVIPFYVNVILFAVYNVIVGNQLAPGRWITNFLGLTLMNEYAWYPIVLIILYIAFYFIFKNIKNKKLCFFLIFLVIFLQGVFFCFNGHFAWWAGPNNWWLNPNGYENAKWWMEDKVIWFFGEWWVNSSIAFLVGMIFAQYEEKIREWFKKGYVLKLILIIVLFIISNLLSGFAQWKMGYWSEWNGMGPGILNKFVCYLSQIPQVCLFVILIYAVMLVYNVQNPVLRFFGNISLETYMMNLIPISVFCFIIYKNGFPYYTAGHYNLAIYEVCTIAASILLGYIYKFLNNQVNKLIK